MRLSSFVLYLILFSIQVSASPISKDRVNILFNEKEKVREVAQLNEGPTTPKVITPSESITAVTQAPESSSTTAVTQGYVIVPYSEWNCGSNELDKWLAYAFIESDCPSKMVETNNCCLVHDMCYADQIPQKECDQAFCQCLDEVLHHKECRHVSKAYCSIVETFGDTAHKNSKDVTTSSSTTTTTQSAIATTEPFSLEQMDEARRRAFQKSVNESLEYQKCFADEYGSSPTCKDNLDSCSQKGSTCICQFCDCSRQRFPLSSSKQRIKECQHSLESLCGDCFTKMDSDSNPYALKENSLWVEERFGLSLPQTIVVVICFLVSLGTTSYWTWRYIRRRRASFKLHGFSNDDNSSSSSADSTASNSSSAASFLFTGEEDSKFSAQTLNCMPLLPN